jgi:hypothetical protein
MVRGPPDASTRASVSRVMSRTYREMITRRQAYVKECLRLFGAFRMKSSAPEVAFAFRRVIERSEWPG